MWLLVVCRAEILTKVTCSGFSVKGTGACRPCLYGSLLYTPGIFIFYQLTSYTRRSLSQSMVVGYVWD